LAISLAGRSLERTTCLPDSKTSLNVWKNSSWMRSLPAQELHVVEQQHVDVAVALPEAGEAVLLQRLDEFVGELLGGEVGDLGIGVVAENAVPDGMHEVGLAQAGVAVNEQRVKGLRGRLGHGERRRVGELVVGADDEVLERVPRVERAREVALNRFPQVKGKGQRGHGGQNVRSYSHWPNGGASARHFGCPRVRPLRQNLYPGQQLCWAYGKNS
jgi:hypothetical protein